MIEVRIIDTGIGIPRENIQKLFHIGEKNKISAGTAGEKGSGLGLVLSKEFVEKNGGSIWVESCVGKGSTFTFTLKKPYEDAIRKPKKTDRPATPLIRTDYDLQPSLCRAPYQFAVAVFLPCRYHFEPIKALHSVQCMAFRGSRFRV